MIHPATALKFISEEIGYGVFATQLIPKGTIVYIQDPLEMVISPEKYAGLIEPLKSAVEKYSYIDGNGNRIVSWDHGKYVNHCCQCNTMSTGYGFEIAIRDIAPGEEITDEYGLFNLEYEMALSCNKPGCRQKIKATDLLTYFDIWDAKVKEALMSLHLVEQPLIPLMDPATFEAISSFQEDSAKYLSVRTLEKKHKDREVFSLNGKA